MSVVDFSQALNSAIQAGQAVEGTAVRIIADNGAEIGDAVFKVIEGGNGQASEVAVATQAGTGGVIATGLAYLTMTIPTACAAIAPCLGVVAGVGLYSLAPEFWNTVSEALVDAGKTVGGKLISYWDGENTYYDQETIEIIKQCLVDIGAFETTEEWDEEVPEEFPADKVYAPLYTREQTYTAIDNYGVIRNFYYGGIEPWGETVLLRDGVRFGNDSLDDVKVTSFAYPDGGIDRLGIIICTKNPDHGGGYLSKNVIPDLSWSSGANGSPVSFTFDNKTVYYNAWMYNFTGNAYETIGSNGLNSQFPQYVAWMMQYGNFTGGTAVELQPNATYPDNRPFYELYTDWTLHQYPQTLPDPEELPKIYPAKYPEIGPDGYPTQDPAQNPDPESVPEIYPVIMPDFPIPNPGINPEPEPEPDPDPQPEPDPIPEEDPNPGRDPVDPNPDPDPSLPIVVPNLPNTVNSSRLFTVYNPTSSQLDALGGYLWDSSIIAAIRDIWQEPMDGLISLQQVFVTPSTSGSHNIILGFLDSGVNAAVVSDQFVTVDCGSVQVNEDKKNATDYAPYTSLHLYLPFIGIVELDTNECMNATISIKYRVDVYTGTCLAQVSVDRDIDMPDDPILYTFSGNCSQQLPLTSGNATGLLTALIGAVTAGFSAASGGGLSTLAGAQLLGNSLTHEMFHVSHSGNISANAGIMGLKKPYLIIGRRHGYDANDYNSYYGYPSNNTIVIGNHTGFLRVKKCWIKTNALQEEYNEIMKLLEEGVFV